MMIDYSKKLTTHREYKEIKNIDVSIESDRGRIISSAAFRRLQKRTQVFALELNASIRSRLTHSLEVAQIARYISKTILKNLSEEEKKRFKLTNLENAFISVAEMASLLHDIGNPPFGHFAEQTINRWIETDAVPIFEKLKVKSQEDENLKQILIKDLKNFDGNAQTVRVITKLQKLNLSYSQILSVVKYGRGAYENYSGDLNYINKKPGFFFSEKELVAKIQNSLNIKKHHRFFIVYIMEAADDISYLTADLEDAIEKNIFNLDSLYETVKKECQKEGNSYLLELLEKHYFEAKKEEKPYRKNLFFALFRAQLAGDLVKHVAKVYTDNHKEIFNGSFNYPLLEFDKNSKYYKAVKILQRISAEYIYQNSEVQQREIQGFTIVNELFNIYKPLIELNYNDFEKILSGNKIGCFISMRLIKRVSKKQISAYKDTIKNLDKSRSKFEMLERYYRIRLLIDYISGMTDDYALYEYQTLLALK